MITSEQLKEAEARTEALKRYLDIDSKKIEVEEEELRTHVADFWDDREKAEAQMRKIRGFISGSIPTRLSRSRWRNSSSLWTS